MVFAWVETAAISTPAFLWIWADVMSVASSEAAVAHLGDWLERPASKLHAFEVNVTRNTLSLIGVKACSIRPEWSRLDNIDTSGISDGVVHEGVLCEYREDYCDYSLAGIIWGSHLSGDFIRSAAELERLHVAQLYREVWV
ncbi:hypothetical protein MRX96_037065 [Rhipicephalus microplus]